MAKAKGTASTTHTSVHKRTSIGHGKLKTSSMNKTKRSSYKSYRGQGK
jgi:hypothetical protein